MPKPRVIDPSFWEDLDVIAVSRDERLLLAAMITAGADDQGLLKANAPYLKRLAFAFDADLTIADVEEMILHIGARCKNVQLYEVNGERYASFTNWDKYQQIKYKAKSHLPALTDTNRICPTLANFGETAPKFTKPPSCSVGLGRVVVGRDGETAPNDAGGLQDKEQEPPPPHRPTQEELGNVFSAYQDVFGPIPSRAVQEEIEGLIEDMADRGGKTGAEWVLLAIQEARDGSHGRLPNLAYLKAIVKGWLSGATAPRNKDGPPNGDKNWSQVEVNRFFKQQGVL